MPEGTETNKVHYDLTNVYIAKMLTDGDEPTWETPKRMYGCYQPDLSAQGDTYKRGQMELIIMYPFLITATKATSISR